ncbi:hypothetical protein [Xanthocytophaga agilis]|uniref:Uncharacterized protein n=1 Tax=Xanthocytophaga agilis TaxID=3048010 RepID=A0AAE3RDM4_9BACT|nr:hypothetical protein [Xanthocytophaga agilis]MDJ1506769.1 hypothetical protein [Xanthocytophaga agilis]
MKALPIEQLEKYANPELGKPINLNEVESLYKESFNLVCLHEYFEGWEFDFSYQKYIDSSEETNLIWISDQTLHINEHVFAYPLTLYAFIQHCNQVGVNLVWNQKILKRFYTE